MASVNFNKEIMWLIILLWVEWLLRSVWFTGPSQQAATSSQPFVKRRQKHCQISTT